MRYTNKTDSQSHIVDGKTNFYLEKYILFQLGKNGNEVSKFLKVTMRHKNEENDKDAQNKNITDTIQSVKYLISLSF